MSYLAPSTKAPFQGRGRQIPNGQRVFPLLRRALSREALELGRILQGQSNSPFLPPVGRDPFRPLVCYDVLSELRPYIPNVAKLYVDAFEPYLIEVYESLLDGTRQKFSNGFYKGWQGQVNLCILTDYLFNQKLGIAMNGITGQIDPRMLTGNHAAILGSFGYTQWEDLFTEYKLIGGVACVFEYSPARAIMTAFPWAYDLGTPEGQHAHFWDFVMQRVRTAKEAQKKKREAVLHIFRKHLGLQLDPKNKIFDPRLLPQNQAAFLAGHGCADWTELARKFDFARFMRWGEGQQDTQKVFRLIKEVLPWIFDLSTPEGKHLHYPDFKEQNMFEGEAGRDLALEYLRHLLEDHHGLRMDEKNRFIDPRLKSIAGQRKFLRSQGFKTGTWGEFVRRYGLDKIFPQVEEFRVAIEEDKDIGSLIKALRVLYAWAFDLSQPEGQHLHFWLFPSAVKWQDKKDSRTALEHEMQHSNIPLEEAAGKCGFNWFKRANLGGLVFYYNGSPHKVFEALYPEKFADGTFKKEDFHPNPFAGQRRKPEQG